MSDLQFENFKVPPAYKQLMVDICTARSKGKKVKKIDVYLDLLEREAARLKIKFPPPSKE